MRAKVTTRFLSESEYAEWNRLVALSPDGSIYSTPEYLDVLCSAGGGRFKILVAERNGQLLGGIGLYERTSRWGAFVSTRLLLYYNGFVLRPHETKYPSERTAQQIEILAALEEVLARANYGRLLLKNRSTLTDVRVFQERGWEVGLSYTYVVPLKDLDALWNRMEQNLRRLVQRCTREGIQLTDDDDFGSFHRMHGQTHERKGFPVYLPRENFRHYFERLKAQGLCRLYHARMPDGRSISAQLVLLGPHPVSHTVCAAADAEYLKLGASAFLRWKVFGELSHLGSAGNDLTDAALNPVTHFKSQLGGDLEACVTLQRPDALAFRFREAASGVIRRVQAAVGVLARRVGLWGAT